MAKVVSKHAKHKEPDADDRGGKRDYDADDPRGSKSRGAKGKFSKASVDYSKGMPSAHCGICEHYQGNHVCEIVAGDIDPEYWCKKFSKERS